MIALWWMTMLYEIRECERLGRILVHLKSSVSSTVTKVVDGDERIIQLACPVRYALFFLVWLPKTFIACVLLVIGTMWLAATGSVVDLILNSVALQFVVEIDETLFGAMFPGSVADRMG